MKRTKAGINPTPIYAPALKAQSGLSRRNDR
jgi:hypothetical protein